MTDDTFEGPWTATERRYLALLVSRCAAIIGAGALGVVWLTRGGWDLPAIGATGWLLTVAGGAGMGFAAFRGSERLLGRAIAIILLAPVIVIIAALVVWAVGLDLLVLLPWGGHRDD